MFRKKQSLPRAIAFVDFEHWYISMERQYSVKPDVKAWANSLKEQYDLVEISIFADFSNPGMRAELEKIRDVTNFIIDTKNPSEHYKKDFTDFIMLDHIYQRAMMGKDIDTFIIFTGDGHFNSVVRFIINQCRKKVGIYGVTNATSSQLKHSASWYKEIPSDTEIYKTYYKLIVETFDYLTVHREFEKNGTFDKIVARVSQKGKIEKKAVSSALEQMLNEGYVYKASAVGEKGKKINILKPNWELLARDGLWTQP
ncbi:MAG: NYN domain-containing protein [Clostridia bacterium]|nr:NYN domain-containing protein [Clostridia bacterium]